MTGMSEPDEIQPNAALPAENVPPERFDIDGTLAAQDSGVADRPGAPTWPIPPGEAEPEPAPPPVGLNWGVVAERLGVDRRVLEHDGIIVLAGEYFPEEGYFLDPVTLTARHVDVGDMALRHGYLLGDLTIRDFRVQIPLNLDSGSRGRTVVRPAGGPLIGLFPRDVDAQRAKQQVLRGSLGTGLVTEEGPLGVELRVERAELAGRVATVIASNGGAVISVGGKPMRADLAQSGPIATGAALPDAEADAPRHGTGSASDSQTRAAELGGSEEFRRL